MADTAGDAEAFMAAAGGTQRDLEVQRRAEELDRLRQDGQRDEENDDDSELAVDHDEQVEQPLSDERKARLQAMEESSDEEEETGNSEGCLHLNRCREISDLEVYKQKPIKDQFKNTKEGKTKCDKMIAMQEKQYLAIQSGKLIGSLQPLPKLIPSMKKNRAEALRQCLQNKSDVLPDQLIHEPILKLHETVIEQSKLYEKSIAEAIKENDCQKEHFYRAKRADMRTAISFGYEAWHALYAQHCLAARCQTLVKKKIEVLEERKKEIQAELDALETANRRNSLREIESGETLGRVKRQRRDASVVQGSVQASRRNDLY